MQAFNPKDVFADRYRLLKRIAQGPFSESWLASNEAVGSKQVLKIYNSLDEKGCKAFRREFERAHHLTHARLVRPTDFDVCGDRPYLSLPHLRRGSTSRLAGKLSEKEIARIMRDVGGALAFIHQPAYNIIHRDLRPGNILLDDDGHYMLNIFDIGTVLEEEFYEQGGQDNTAVSGDAGMEWRPYRAPEYFGNGDNSQILAASDVWALGAALFELAAGEPPFGQTGGESQLQGQPAPRLPSRFSRPLSIILKQCLAEAPAGRPSAENLRLMAMDYLNTGQWPVQHSTDKSRSPAAGSWKRTGTLFFRRLRVAFNLLRRRVRTPKLPLRIGLPKLSYGRTKGAFPSFKRPAETWKVIYRKAGAAFASLRTQAGKWTPSLSRISVAFINARTGIGQLSYRRAGLVLLAGLLLTAGLILPWPKWGPERGLAEDRGAMPDSIVHQPINRKPSLEEKGPDGAEVEKKAVNNPVSGFLAEALKEEVPESIYTFPPPVPEKKKPPQPSSKQPAPPARENGKAKPAPAPPQKKKTEEARKKEQPAKPEAGAKAAPPQPGSGTETEEELIKPKLNGLTKKWGYVDKSGTWMIWPQFEEASPFKNGKARVVIKAGNEVLRHYHLDTNGYLTPITDTEEGGGENN